MEPGGLGDQQTRGAQRTKMTQQHVLPRIFMRLSFLTRCLVIFDSGGHGEWSCASFDFARV